MQKKAYTCLCSLLSCTSASHRAFINDHVATLQQVILESQSTLSAASKKVSANWSAENTADIAHMEYLIVQLFLNQ